MEGASLDTVKAWVQQAHHVAVLTGAGISAESGVSTFRDAQAGYWTQFRPEDIATEAGFRAHPQRVWDWYQYRRDLLTGVAPNAGHQALAAFAQHTRIGSRSSPRTWTVCTSARVASACWACMGHLCTPLTGYAAQLLPHRPRRGGPAPVLRSLLQPAAARRGVVWRSPAFFTLESAQHAARTCDLMLVVGTAGAVYPAAGLAHQARAAGGRVVVVNPAPSKLDSAAHGVLRGTTATVLPELLVTG